MPKKSQKFSIDAKERELLFHPMRAKFMRENRDLMKSAVIRSSSDDLIEQMPIVVQSLKPVHGDEAETIVDELEIPDLAVAIRVAMEASGFAYVTEATKPGEDEPVKG